MENINIDITEIISAIITLIGIVLTTFVVPYIKSKTTSTQYNTIEAIVKVAVYAAESFYNSANGQGAEKKEYVMNYVKGKCEALGFTFDEGDVSQMIEKSWIELTGGVSDSSQFIDDSDNSTDDE